MEIFENFLKGKKTIIGIVLLALYNIGLDQGFISEMPLILELLWAWTGVSFAVKVNRTAK